MTRLAVHPDEPECLAGLVQVLRFRGMLRESLQAHGRAVELDPLMTTSVAHTHFALGDYAAAIESYSGRAAYYLDAAAWAALHKEDHAVALLHDRLGRMALSDLMSALMRSLLALLQGKQKKAVRLMEEADATYEPEVMMYFARHFSHLKMVDRAMKCLNTAMAAGFVCAPETLRGDPWLEATRKHAEFDTLLSTVERIIAGSRRDIQGFVVKTALKR
jgi:tetratricopeptide (TPR) repeat protein